jgi:hypothetical protein
MLITISTFERIITDGFRNVANVRAPIAWHFAAKRCMTRAGVRLRVDAGRLPALS